MSDSQPRLPPTATQSPDGPPYAPLRHVADAAECSFYHCEELAGMGQVGSEWDLRGVERDYLGGVSFAGKRVLEMGKASGYLCRHMEKLGAEVVAFDLAPGASWDLVPFAHLDVDFARAELRRHIDRINNAWWLARRLCGSPARVVYGDVYDVPAAIGPVDITTFGAILLHLRDPFRALESALRLTRETVVVTEVHPEQPKGSAMPAVAPAGSLRKSDPGTLFFLPHPRTADPLTGATWWSLPPALVRRFLGVLGFADSRVVEHEPRFQGRKARLYTVVATRTAPFRG